MSRNRARKKPTLQRAAIPVSTATSGPVVTIPLSVWNQMYQSMAPQKSQAETFSPGAPLQPIPGITPASGPRQWSYMPGFNLAGNDRTLQRDYIPAFQQLRLLAQTYNAIGTAERIWCDLIPRMDMQVTLTDELKAQGQNDKDYVRERMGYLNFFEKPDGQDDYHEWLRKGVVDQTQIDALVLFKRRTRGGKLQGLDVLDGADIKPLLDERGRIPVPPYAAYQQYSYGTPGQAYTTDDMIYYRESPRTFSPYGFSRVERIITIVNIALRKQQKDLLRYTDGNIPAGLMEVPDTSGWTPDQIETFEQMWNSLLAGNAQQQVRIKFTQPGMKYTAFDQPEAQMHLTEFDTFLLNITAGVYGVSMADLAMTGDIHKSSDDGQQNMLYRRTIEPLAIAYGRIFTKILHEDIGDTRFVVKFGGYDEKEDVGQQVASFAQGVQNGLIAPSDAATMLGWPDLPKTGAFILPQGGQPLFLEDMADSTFRKVQQESRIANLQASEVSDDAVSAQDSGANAGETPQNNNEQELAEDDEQASNPERSLVLSPSVAQQIADILEASLMRFDPAHNAWSGKFDFWAGKKQQQAVGHPTKNAPGDDTQQDKAEQQKEAQQDQQQEQAQDQQQQSAPVTHTHSHSHGGRHHSHSHTHHGSHHHHSGRHGTHGSHKGKHVDVHKAMGVLSTRASKAAARFAKLAARKIGKHWTVAQQQAAQALSKLFATLADHFEDIKPEHAEQVMKQILAQGEALYGKGSTQYTHLQALLDRFDARMDKIGVDRADMADEFDDDEGEDTWIDEDETSRVADAFAIIDEQMRIIRALNVTPEEPDLVSQMGACTCDLCRGNHGKIVESMPPYHDGCDCTVVEQGEEREQRAQQDAESVSQRAGDRTRSGSVVAADAPARAAGLSEIDHSHDGSEQAARSADYRRWRERALADVKASNPQRPFTSELIPEHERQSIARALTGCATADDVRMVFERARERDASFFVAAASNSGGNPASNKSAWKLRW